MQLFVRALAEPGASERQAEPEPWGGGSRRTAREVRVPGAEQEAHPCGKAGKRDTPAVCKPAGSLTGGDALGKPCCQHVCRLRNFAKIYLV